MADSVRRRLRQTTHSTRGAVLTGARWLGLRLHQDLGGARRGKAGPSRRVGAPPSQSAG